MYRFILIFLCVILTTGAGYKGQLPNISADFAYKTKKPAKTSPPYTPSLEEVESELKQIPRDDKSYVEIIIKKDKTSQYSADINTIFLILEKLKKCIENNQDIQKFNAIASNLIDHITLLETTYQGKQECQYISYKSLQNLSLQTRKVAILKTEAQVYNKYLPYSGNGASYNPNNIQKQLNGLLTLINDNLYILKNLD